MKSGHKSLFQRAVKQLCCRGVAYRIACNEFRRKFVDDRLDHDVEIGNLIIEVQEPAGQRFKGNAASGVYVAVAARIWPPSG